MTYDELGSLFRCEPENARNIVLKMDLDHRKSPDGEVRVKLNAQLNDLFFDRLFALRIDCELRDRVDDLRAAYDRMVLREKSAVARIRQTLVAI